MITGGERPWVKRMCRAYALMTLAYPRAFRERFGREMRLAFRSEALATAERSGDLALLALAFRLGGDWAITLWKEYAPMRKYLLAAPLVLALLAVDWLAFHDWREPHTVRDYLTLAASLLLFAYVGSDLFGARRQSGPEAR
jgi:hypothetical protein